MPSNLVSNWKVLELGQLLMKIKKEVCLSDHHGEHWCGVGSVHAGLRHFSVCLFFMV